MLITFFGTPNGRPCMVFGCWQENFQEVATARSAAVAAGWWNYEQRLSTDVRKPPASTGCMEGYQAGAGERRV